MQFSARPPGPAPLMERTAKVNAAPPDRDQIAAAARALGAFRDGAFRIHCLTNMAAAAFTADVLLALGARPSLTHAPAEVEHFSSSADALLVNLGTLDEDRISGFTRAVAVMNKRRAPWVLDPVLCDRSRPRRALALELLGLKPAIIRLNQGELRSLTGGAENDAAGALARKHGVTVIVTGERDFVTDGERAARIGSGHAFMDRGTAFGCAGAAVTAACAGIGQAPFEAAVSSLLIFNQAGAIAGRAAAGPGSFRPLFLDALYHMTASDLSTADFQNIEAAS